MSTIHIAAGPDDYAELVLLPGDPLRAKFIAENFLDNATQVTDVRNMLGFTGTFKGKAVSVQGSGMGIPSMQIYATELIKDYGVKRLARVGSCGALAADIELGDVVIALAAGTDSGVNRRRLAGNDMPATASWSMLRALGDQAESSSIKTHIGKVFTSDFFYDPSGDDLFGLLSRFGFLAVEMEAAGLYGVAAEYGAEAVSVMTVSDNIKTGAAMSVEQRQTSFDDMISLVLDALI